MTLPSVSAPVYALICTIMVHDFWIRVDYHVVLPFLIVEARADTLGVFRKRPDIDFCRVQNMLAEYQYLPSDNPPRLRIYHAIKRRIGKRS